jgi:hypothetical protein
VSAEDRAKSPASAPDPEYVARVVNVAWAIAEWRGAARSCIARLRELEAAERVPNDAWFASHRGEVPA